MPGVTVISISSPRWAPERVVSPSDGDLVPLGVRAQKISAKNAVERAENGPVLTTFSNDRWTPSICWRPASARVSEAFAAAPGPVRTAVARQTRRTVVDRGANVRRAVSTSRPTPTPDEGISIGRQATRVPGVDTYIQDSEKRVRTTSTARRDADGPVAWRPINTVFDGRGSRANAVRRDATRRPAAWGRWTATSTASGGAAGP